MRFAYADPPYVGQAVRHYGNHPDFAGEVDMGELIARLETDYDGWALSLSAKSLPEIMALCPKSVTVLAWCVTNPTPFPDMRMYAWEPVILHGGRPPEIHTRTAIVASTPFRGHQKIVGEKPREFSLWLFASAGLQPSDEFCDLYPGSGAVTRAWQQFSTQGNVLRHSRPGVRTTKRRLRAIPGLPLPDNHPTN